MSNPRRYRVTASGADGKFKVHSNVGYNIGGSPANTLIGGMVSNAGTYTSLLTGIIQEDDQVLQKIYEDIYKYDATCGTTADLRATLISSPFSLSGLKDSELEVFNHNLERLGYPSILPQHFLDMYVRGKFISTLLYNKETNTFSDQMVWSAGDCIIKDSPLYNAKPSILLRPSRETVEFFQEETLQAEKIRRRLNPEVVEALKRGSTVELIDTLTLYMPKPSISGIPSGQSLFRRVVPLYILEKLLYRGTYSEAQRRQRAIMHITAGGDDWQPIESELQAIIALFQQADLDPTGAIIATRNDINVGEVRSAGDFWKWTDLLNDTSQWKLRAMGTSEAFLSGESSYNAMEVALSVFLENLRAERDQGAKVIFEDHLFPLIAHTNGYKHPVDKTRSRFKATGGVPTLTSNTGFDLNNPRAYRTPKMHWEKSLRPEGDSERLQTMQTLSEMGVPISLSMIAAAGGVNLDDILQHADREKELEKKIAKYKAAIDSLKSSQDGGEGGGDDGDDGGYDEEARLRLHLAEAEYQLNHQPRSVFNRMMDLREETRRNGKAVPSASSVRERSRQIDTAVQVMRNLSSRSEYEAAVKRSKSMASALRRN